MTAVRKARWPGVELPPAAAGAGEEVAAAEAAAGAEALGAAPGRRGRGSRALAEAMAHQLGQQEKAAASEETGAGVAATAAEAMVGAATVEVASAAWALTGASAEAKGPLAATVAATGTSLTTGSSSLWPPPWRARFRRIHFPCIRSCYWIGQMERYVVNEGRLHRTETPRLPRHENACASTRAHAFAIFAWRWAASPCRSDLGT